MANTLTNLIPTIQAGLDKVARDPREFRDWWQGKPEAFPNDDMRLGTYGHALTAHKAQGSEYRRVTVFMPKMDNVSAHFRKSTELPDGTKIPFGVRFFYTACSRAKEQLTVLVGR